MAEAVRLGLSVRPPHVNHSRPRFSLGWEGEGAVLWMGLGQVRDLRRSSVRRIVAGRLRPQEDQPQPYADLRDLQRRVPLQRKEVVHLIQCGALDGLGESRAALLAQAEEIEQAGSALQMTFDFVRPQIPPETPAQRLAWERHLLGQPVSVHPLEVVDVGDRLPLRRLPEHTGQRVTVAGVRLPSWSGGQGFYLGDEETFVVARGGPAFQAPPPWAPVVVQGRWVDDEWRGSWLQVEGLERIELDMGDSAAE
jgi:DNA polymerase III alpha subunit